MVPASSTDSGITFAAVPPRIFETLSTAGSDAGTSRPTKVCSAPIISAAAGIGSRQSWGMEAWPPRPRTTHSKKSADAKIGPGRVAMVPQGSSGLM